LSDPGGYAASPSGVRTSKPPTRVENEMIRFAIAMFLLLLLGVAVEELAGRSAEQPEASADVVEAAQ
jgi:hypothetical protein